jgi:hypothetical protein
LSVTLSSGLPNDDRNGIGAISAALVDDPEGVQVVVAVVDCSKITTKVDTGDVVPTARILGVEAFESGSAIGKQLQLIVRRQYAQRTGREELPFPPTPPASD